MAGGGMMGPAGAGGGMPGMMSGGRGGMPGMGMGGMMGVPVPVVPTLGDPTQPLSQRLGELFFVTSPEGDKVSIKELNTGKAKSLRLSDSKDSHFKIFPLTGSGFLALQIQGKGVKRIAVFVDGCF